MKQFFPVFLGYLQRKQLVSLPCKRKQCYYTPIQRQNLLHSVALQGQTTNGYLVMTLGLRDCVAGPRAIFPAAFQAAAAACRAAGF